jgi:hypothetical protein
MKGITRTKAPPIEALEDYVRKVGLDRFSYVPGYKYGHFSLASSTAINRIAWGLARAQLRDKADVRPRTWFAKTFYQSINRFIDAVITRYLAAISTHLPATLRVN